MCNVESHDPEKLQDFSDEIMCNVKSHDPEKLQDFSDEIMRNVKSHDREKLQTFRTRSCATSKATIPKTRGIGPSYVASSGSGSNLRTSTRPMSEMRSSGMTTSASSECCM
jgi:hypothetical protein